MTPEVLAVRGLNACRQVHKPTYVGLRALLETDLDHGRVQWAVNLASRKARCRTEPRYYKFKSLKEINDKGVPEYRDFMVGSPTTLLLEAQVLSLMASEKSFEVPANVYSNLWPKSSNGGRSFQYFASGYAKRNSKIRSVLKERPNYVAVVSDIRRFYPSVKWDNIEPRLQRRIASIASTPHRMAIENCTQMLRSVHPDGIPIGPEVAHVLGTVALEDVDDRLDKEFGSNYFRYVDDIIVLCPKKEFARTQSTIREVVKRSEFEIHDGKDDVVPAGTWVTECPEFGGRKESNSFESLVHDLCLLLSAFPHRVDGLRKQFHEVGFSLPLSRIASQTKYGPFKQYFRGVAKSLRSFQTALVVYRSDDKFIASAQRVRESLWKSLESMGGIPDSGKGMQRRWYVQQVRYRINRLLYLTGPADFASLRELIPSGSEFEEYRILLDALASGDVTDLLRLPGRAVSAFCELVSEGPAISTPVSFSNLKERAIAESATSMGIYFGWKPSDDERREMYEGSRALLEIATGGVDDVSNINPMSYLDEMELVLRDHSSEQMREIARTRHFEGESLGLEALGLGGGYGFS